MLELFYADVDVAYNVQSLEGDSAVIVASDLLDLLKPIGPSPLYFQLLDASGPGGGWPTFRVIGEYLPLSSWLARRGYEDELQGVQRFGTLA